MRCHVSRGCEDYRGLLQFFRLVCQAETNSHLTDGVDGPSHRRRDVPCWVCHEAGNRNAPSAITLTSFGMNLAAGKIVIRKKLGQRTVLLNAFRCNPAVFGLIAQHGPPKGMELIAQMREGALRDLPEIALTALVGLAHIRSLGAQDPRSIERCWTGYRQDSTRQRLETIPDIGGITGTALPASVPDSSMFRVVGQFAAFLGIRPRLNASGGRQRLAGLTDGRSHTCDDGSCSAPHLSSEGLTPTHLRRAYVSDPF